jgi:hypothetical protein
MKKTYSQPACLVVVLGTTANVMVQASLVIDRNSSNTITEEGQILTKENKDVNVWDNEW